MSECAAVVADGLGKRFKLYKSAWARLADWCRLPPSPRYAEFWALRNVSFSLQRGECLGIVGHNGAGKSTLLKLLTGVLTPTTGRVEVPGRVLSLLELGTGFEPDLTGRQNIEYSAQLLGLEAGYASSRMAEIESFAELGDYFDRPVRFYSSGMFVRLAFSLFSAMQPDVFLVDEALAVGDMRFASKALARVRRMLSEGTTMIFVSHDLQLINQLCSRVLWLHSGSVQLDSGARDVTRAYQQFWVHGIVPDQAAEEDVTADPVATDDSELYVGRGWYALEAFGGEVFRWAGPRPQIIVNSSDATAGSLFLEIEPGPSAGGQPLTIEVASADEDRIASFVVDGRMTVCIGLPPIGLSPVRLTLIAVDASKPVPGDERVLNFRVLRYGWSADGPFASIRDAPDWNEDTLLAELGREQTNMKLAARRSPPASNAAARIVRVVTRDAAGAERVRFASGTSFALEVIVEALTDVHGLATGIQIRDQFDRLIWGSRSDWQQAIDTRLHSGERCSIVLSTEELLLGPGLYHVTVAICPPRRDESVWHWIDGAWRFEVISPAGPTFVGVVDLGWRFVVSKLDHASPLERLESASIPIP